MAALLGAGCEQIIGANFGVETVECAHAEPPGPPNIQATGGDAELVFAINWIDTGDGTEGDGGPNYKSIGFDLDGVCANQGQAPSCQPVAWAHGDNTDGVGGIDNAIGNVMFSEQHGFGGAMPLVCRDLNAAMNAGTNVPIAVLRVRGYHPGSDDDQVDVDWYVPGKLTDADGGPAMPAWNGSDVWPIHADSLADGGLDQQPDGAPAYPRSIFHDSTAFVTSYQIVTHLPADTLLTLANVTYPIKALELVIHLSPGGGGIRASDGVAGGRLTTKTFFQELRAITTAIGVPLCANDPTYPRIKTFLCAFPDVLASGADPNAQCDAYSLGFNFKVAPVQLGPTVPTPRSPSCPAGADPATDSCEDGGSPAPVDATSDHINDEANCVKPGTPNNEVGVGGYCETDSDCAGTLCSGVYGAPVHDWFCTKLCKIDSDCGSGEYCAHNDPRGVACVPLTCGSPDAGADGGGDATGD
jgi:hypothetical protein